MKGIGPFLISIAVAGVGAGLTIALLNGKGIYLGFVPAFLLWMGIYWGAKKLMSKKKEGA